jgi:hypothetical protein
MKHISAVISELFDRGSLPERVEMRAAMGPARPGDTLTWDPGLKAYRLISKPWFCIRAGIVRNLWGEFFLSSKKETQPCLAL